MFDSLTNLGYGLVLFAVIIGVGTVILVNFGGSVGCSDTTINTFNTSTNLCQEPANLSNTASPGGGAYTNTAYLTGQLGSSGLAGWTPAIIAVMVGVMFLGVFMIKGGRKRKY